MEFHDYTLLETIIYCVNPNILPFAEKKLIAECKDNAYLYRETPINKLLKFSAYFNFLITLVILTLKNFRYYIKRHTALASVV